MASRVDINRVEWEPAPQLCETFGDLVYMILDVLRLQDDLRREKGNKPVTGLLELRTPEKLIEGIQSECGELLEGIRRGDRVNQYEEMSDLLLRLARIIGTLELDSELIVKIFFVKARAIAVADSTKQQRDKAAERSAMDELVLEYEGEI